MEILESQLSQQETDNLMLREKLQTSVSTYNQDLQHYHSELSHHKALVDELKHSLQQKTNELAQEKASNHSGSHNMNNQTINYSKISNGDQQTVLEKELLLKLENEKKKCLEME